MRVGLGFSNEFRAERAAEALHSRVRHTAVVLRDRTTREVDVTALVPGVVVQLRLGAIIPAALRLLRASDLRCDERVLTSESLPVGKDPAPVAGGAALGNLTSCLFVGTVIQSVNCTGAVVATGGQSEFGRRQHEPGHGHPAPGQVQGAGQAAGLHRGPGRHGHPRYRQDRDGHGA